MTPEGRVKAAVNRLLKKFEPTYKFMPVQTGYGMKTLDYLLCVCGRFVAIETKAPGKHLTALQEATKRDIERAGGLVLVIDGSQGLKVLEEYLNAVCASQRQA